jgi:LPS export ABC transporter protein LptC
MLIYKKDITPKYSSILKKTGRLALSFLTFTLYLIAGLGLLAACKTNDQDLSKLASYKGPLMESDNIERLYSDRAIIRVRMTAPREEQMENEDMLYPKGVYFEFYDEKQVRSSTLRANAGVFNKAKQLYTVTGNVVIVDSVKAQTMNTEELHWDPAKQLIYTDKFVTIQTKKEVLKGEGLEAKEDFSNWRILKPKGILPINQQ